jgi:hypothetical protein
MPAIRRQHECRIAIVVDMRHVGEGRISNQRHHLGNGWGAIERLLHNCRLERVATTRRGEVARVPRQVALVIWPIGECALRFDECLRRHNARRLIGLGIGGACTTGAGKCAAKSLVAQLAHIDLAATLQRLDLPLEFGNALGQCVVARILAANGLNLLGKQRTVQCAHVVRHARARCREDGCIQV